MQNQIVSAGQVCDDPVSEAGAAFFPPGLPFRPAAQSKGNITCGYKRNKLSEEDRPFHDWYRFVLSFPPHLVRQYLKERFQLPKDATVLDPFCGTGTTAVEAKKNGLKSLGLEANDVAYFAGKVKVDWSTDPEELCRCAEKIAASATRNAQREQNLRKLDSEKEKLILKNSICPIPLHKILVLTDEIESAHCPNHIKDSLKLSVAKTLVFSASNLHFGPEVGIRGQKNDAPVFDVWLNNVKIMADDLAAHERRGGASAIYKADSRNLAGLLKERSIDAVFTSPPYPNEKDYTRTTRLESVVLGFVNSKEELRQVKKGLLRSNTRGVYKGDSDDSWIEKNSRVNAIANEIERRRIELGKTSGFEKLYGRVTRLYFGGMARHLAELRPYLKRDAMLGYVVGDHASYLQVMIRTGEILAEIADKLGYEVLGMDFFRSRLATATKMHMKEEIVVLKWNK